MVDVVVEHDYTALEADELTIKKGDVIREVVKMKGGWWEGVLNDKRGMFPDNFVKEIQKDSSVNHKRKDVIRMRQCRVLFSYKQDHLDELELNVGDIINIIGEEEEGWWRGHLNGREGVFPSNFVEEIKFTSGSREDLTNINEIDKTPTLPPKPTKIMCQVKYSYKAQNEDELTLKEGDLINLISKDGQDPGWWKGELNGQIGVFPDNFVIILENNEQKLNRSENVPFKNSTIATQRKSLGEKLEADNAVSSNLSGSNKKPAVPVKKSPSSGTIQGGILAGLRKRIVDGTTSSSKNHSQIKVSETKYDLKEVERTLVVTDVKTMAKASDIVDGSSSSKIPQLLKVSEIKEEFKEELYLENAFDHVERSSMLSDVRATRAKAPGRRPPSVIFKDGEPGVVNGNTDHIHMDMLIESLANSRSTSMNDQGELTEAKPRVREWEKHKAPWLEEMKLSQAKRTSTSPSNEPSKLKLTPTDKSGSPDSDEVNSPLEKTLIADASTSLSPANSLTKLSPNVDKHPVVLRHKNPQVSVRPQTISNIDQNKHDPTKPLSIINSVQSVNQNNKGLTNPKPQVACRSPDIKATGDVNPENISDTHYMELLQRIEKLETLVEFQQQTYTVTVEELKGKILRLENEIRNPNINV